MSKYLEEIKTLRGFNKIELGNDENVNKSLDILEEAIEVLDIIKMARKNIETGRYIDYDNPCLMIKDYKGNVVDWYKLDEEKIDKVNKVLNEV